MGNIRTPRPDYFKHGVVLYYVKDKEIFYLVKLWTSDGLSQFTFDEGKYDSSVHPETLIWKAQESQKFTNVRAEN